MSRSPETDVKLMESLLAQYGKYISLLCLDPVNNIIQLVLREDAPSELKQMAGIPQPIKKKLN